MFAASNNHMDVIQALLDAKVDLEARMPHGSTALIVAPKTANSI